MPLYRPSTTFDSLLTAVEIVWLPWPLRSDQKVADHSPSPIASYWARTRRSPLVFFDSGSGSKIPVSTNAMVTPAPVMPFRCSESAPMRAG